MTKANAPFVVALEPDLFFAVRIDSAVKAAGARPVTVDNPAALWDAIERWPELVIVDLAVEGWIEPVRRAKTLPHTKSIPIVAFGSHVDTGALRAAREAGCDHAWARSRFTSELPDLLQEILHPAVRHLDGWDEPPPPALCRGIAQFNAGEYWECHETLEALWIAEQRPIRDLYQGILQVGIAFHHLRQNNHAGALKMFRRGLPRLRGLPDVCQGVHIAHLSATARRIHDAAQNLGPDRLAELNEAFPQINVSGCS
jgi:predicted metal-dependent hydrolase/CheY-like chemotaxis protein